LYANEYRPEPKYETVVTNPVSDALLPVFDPLAVNNSPPEEIWFPKESSAVTLKLADAPTVAMDKAVPVTLDRAKQAGPGTTKNGEKRG
jgi:hypothetical protein